MTLRVVIDGQWSAADFAAFFDEIDRYHEFCAVRFRILAFSPDGNEQIFARRASFSRPISVKRISFASPGFTDLVGLGALTKEIREFLQFLILHIRDREDRKLDREEKRIRVARARLELLEKLHAMRRIDDEDAPLRLSAEAAQFIELPKFDRLADAVMEGRILDIVELDEDDEGTP